MIVWLTASLTNWLINWLIGWLIGCWINIDWLIDEGEGMNLISDAEVGQLMRNLNLQQSAIERGETVVNKSGGQITKLKQSCWTKNWY